MFRLVLLLICLQVTVGTAAQKQKTIKAVLTENSIVKDTAGNEVPTEVWQQLARSSHYALYPENAAIENSPFIIRYLTEEERAARLDKMPRPRDSRFFRNGKPFGSFAEKDLAGNRFNVKELKGKVVVVNFWFINCPPCRQEIPELNRLVEKYKENSEVVFLAVALDARYELQQFLSRMPFNYNIIADGVYIARKFGVTAFPTHVVVDREGLVKFHTAGLAPNTVRWVQKSIDEALAQPAAADAVVGN